MPIEFHPEECAACEYPFSGLDLKKVSGKNIWLCELCSNTFSGNIVLYPKQYRDTAPMYQHVSYCTNLILEAIKDLKSELVEKE